MTDAQIKELLNARDLFSEETQETSTPQDNPTVYQFAQLGWAAQHKLLRNMDKGELHFYWPHVASSIREKFLQRNGGSLKEASTPYPARSYPAPEGGSNVPPWYIFNRPPSDPGVGWAPIEPGEKGGWSTPPWGVEVAQQSPDQPDRA